MNREDMEFFQQYFDSFNSEFANLRAEIATMRSEMATKHDLREIRKTMVTYSSFAQRLFRQLTGSQVDMSADIEDLKRRVAEIERRLPPEAAA